MESIPYDPALALGQIVPMLILDRVLAISEAAGPADAAQEELNAFILAKRSLDMTIQELMSMGIDPAAVILASKELGKECTEAAVKYAAAQIVSQKMIAKLRGVRAAIPVSASVESPIDFVQSQLKGIPLSADSFKMDAQFFTADTNTEGEVTTTSAVSGYIASSTMFLGSTSSRQMTMNAQAAMHTQYQNHTITGTLVITAGATHKQAQLFAPCVIDPDKLVKAWNMTFPKDQLDPVSPASLVKAVYSKPSDKQVLRLLSGATYGSSFVGMVHLLNVTTTMSSEVMMSIAESYQTKLDIDLFLASYTSSMGQSSSSASDVRALLSNNTINAHCSLVTMGIIPSIVANDSYKTSVKILDTSGAANTAAMGKDTADANTTINSVVQQTMNNNQMQAMTCAQTTAVLGALGSLDSQANKVIDTAALMTSFEDYVQRAVAGGDNFGVPINYWMKILQKRDVAMLWVHKYYPKLLTAGDNDNVKGPPDASGGSSGSST